MPPRVKKTEQNSTEKKTRARNNKNVDPISDVVLSESVAESVSESSADFVAEPPAESIPEPVPESVSESSADSVPESVAEPVPESVAEPVPESVSEVPESILETIPGPPSEPVSVDVTVQQVIQTLSESSIVVPEVINTNIENETPKNEIEDVIKELSTSNGIKIIKPEYELDTSELNNILKDIETNNSLSSKNDLVQQKLSPNSLFLLKEVFDKFTHSALLFQVKDRNIKYIEKKGKELRNQSIIDLIQATHKNNPLPNKTFIVYTNNFNLNTFQNESLLTVFGSKLENTKLFPSYIFNYFKKNNNIYSFENITKNLQENSIQWNEKKEQIYISESKINSVINNLYTSSALGLKKNISGNKNFAFNEEFEKIQQYKYIISVNTSENSYLLPFYLSSGACVILMKNNNKALYLEEFYYKEYIAGEDYIEINYDNNESDDEKKADLNL